MATALSLNEIRRRCAKLVSEWQGEKGEERQQAQSFVRDLLSAFGIRKTKAALYERRAKRSSTGSQGYIDALLPGLCLIEMKSRGKNLAKAEEQALDYIDDLPDVEQPRWVITSDFGRFRVLDLEAEPGEDGTIAPIEFALEELPVNADSLAFLAGYQVRSFGDREQEKASIKAAQMMGHLYEALEGSGYNDHEASVFLVRTLFALYADDAGMWERDLFFEFLDSRTSEDGSDLGPRLAQLYQVMNQPLEKRQKNLDELVARFPYVNGGVFAEPLTIPSFDKEMRDLLLEASAFNWSGISPAIFGSLFQAVKSAKARRSLGEHYTTETNILKTINPLFMDELRERFTKEFHSKPGLKKLREDLASVRVLDPACGCGNFIVVAYRELRTLDLDILERLQALGDTSLIPTLFFSREDLPVTLDHFYGIEIEEWPARIATTALHLVDHQANQRMELALGKAPGSLPLQTLANIHVANALRTDWAEVVEPSAGLRIVGNPPFIGARKMSADQKKEITDLWGPKSGDLDYVTGWYKKVAEFFGTTPGARFAFVSTNSVAQGAPVAALFRPTFEAGWRIRFAHQTFAWSSEAPGMAHVHCVIIGFDRGEKVTPKLYSYEDIHGAPAVRPVPYINAYLTNGPNVLVTARTKALSPELPACLFGSMANDDRGNLLVSPEQYPQVAADPVASKYLRRFIQADELINGNDRWCLWMAEDFDPNDLNRSSLLKERVENVRKARAKSGRAATRKMAELPYLFQENHQPSDPYVAIPRHFSESRRFATVGHYEPEVICGDANFSALDPDGFLFAILSSSMFIAWQGGIGGRIKSDIRFSKEIVWNNLPLSTVEPKLRKQVCAAGQGVLDARALHPERSLAEHYNPLAMDPELVKAHNALDRVVDKAFGAPKALADNEQRLVFLQKRYAEMTA